jgi:hypothetical protein
MVGRFGYEFLFGSLQRASNVPVAVAFLITVAKALNAKRLAVLSKQ